MKPSRANRPGDQPLPSDGEGDILAELAHTIGPALLERRRLGVARYGKPLQANNGRDVHRDLREELLDALAYAEQARVERSRLEAQLADLKRRALPELLRKRLVAYLSAHAAEDQARDAYGSPALWLLEHLSVLSPRGEAIGSRDGAWQGVRADRRSTGLLRSRATRSRKGGRRLSL